MNLATSMSTNSTNAVLGVNRVSKLLLVNFDFILIKYCIIISLTDVF